MKVSGSLSEKHGKYYAVYRINNKQKWKCLGIPTTPGHKREAEKALKRLLQHCEEGLVDIYDISFIDFLDLWIEEIKPHIKPSTWEGYKSVIECQVKPYFAEYKYKLRELKGRHFSQFFVYLHENGRKDKKGGLKKKAISNIKGVLSSAFKYAVKNDYVNDNVIDKSDLPLFDEPQFEPTIYTPEQIKMLLDYAEKTQSNLKLFLFLALFTGARKGEILALTWDNVDLENGTIFICQNRTGSKSETQNKLTTPKTKNGNRVIPLSPKVLAMLSEEKSIQEQNKKLLADGYKVYPYDYVIRQANGSIYHPHSVNRAINKMTTRIGLPHCRIHDYRHAVASMLFEGGAKLSDVTIQLGHGQTSTTEKIYVHQKRVAKRDNIQMLSNLIGI